MAPDRFEKSRACVIKSTAFCVATTHTKEADEEATSEWMNI